MKSITLKKTLNLKDGTTVPVGSIVTFVRHGAIMSAGVFNWNGRELKLRYKSVVKAPSIRTLEKWEGEGYCKSVFGDRTETDGYGSLGEPSWCLAYGLV
jgi:hypothetical protein